jgi:hypothetical protein
MAVSQQFGAPMISMLAHSDCASSTPQDPDKAEVRRATMWEKKRQRVLQFVAAEGRV